MPEGRRGVLRQARASAERNRAKRARWPGADLFVNPFTLWALKEAYHMDAADGRSKSCEDVARVEFDFVTMVCDKARGSYSLGCSSPTDFDSNPDSRRGNTPQHTADIVASESWCLLTWRHTTTRNGRHSR